MYSTEFSKKVPIGKVEQVMDGSCFLPEGSHSNPQNLEDQVTVKGYTAFKVPD